MESGGTRMGSRSSTRYGPASVFSGPVRKWKKRWIPYPSSSSSTTTSTSSSAPTSRLCLYKWTSINGGAKEDTAEEPPPRKVHYVPVCVIEEQRKEAVKIEVTQNAEVAMPIADSNKGDIDMEETVESAIIDAEATNYAGMCD